MCRDLFEYKFYVIHTKIPPVSTRESINSSVKIIHVDFNLHILNIFPPSFLVCFLQGRDCIFSHAVLSRSVMSNSL